MRLLLQRVSSAQVDVDGETVGKIDRGILALAGFGAKDGLDLPGTMLWRTMLGKIGDLRIFPDEQDRMNLSLKDTDGGLLVVSQFTLYAGCRKGRRPSFTPAAPPDIAEQLYDTMLKDLDELHPGRTASGIFGAMMDVSLVNWGPVTIMLDSEDFS